MMEQKDIQDAAILRGSTGYSLAAVLLVSLGAVGFLLWLVYGRIPPAEYAQELTFLPWLNAFFNALSATALICGYRYVRRRQLRQHQWAMTLAFVFSSLFLISYILNHALHGETRYPLHGFFRTGYLWMLGSHILLSIVALPVILFTFFLSLSGRFSQHRKLARYTFPIWLYVSATGVIVTIWLRAALP